MRLGQLSSGIRAFTAKVKLKWSDYWSEILQSIAEEEVGIRRVEYDKHIESRQHNGESPQLTGLIRPD